MYSLKNYQLISPPAKKDIFRLRETKVTILYQRLLPKKRPVANLNTEKLPESLFSLFGWGHSFRPALVTLWAWDTLRLHSPRAGPLTSISNPRGTSAPAAWDGHRAIPPAGQVTGVSLPSQRTRRYRKNVPGKVLVNTALLLLKWTDLFLEKLLPPSQIYLCYAAEIKFYMTVLRIVYWIFQARGNKMWALKRPWCRLESFWYCARMLTKSQRPPSAKPEKAVCVNGTAQAILLWCGWINAKNSWVGNRPDIEPTSPSPSCQTGRDNFKLCTWPPSSRDGVGQAHSVTKQGLHHLQRSNTQWIHNSEGCTQGPLVYLWGTPAPSTCTRPVQPPSGHVSAWGVCVHDGTVPPSMEHSQGRRPKHISKSCWGYWNREFQGLCPCAWLRRKRSQGKKPQLPCP